MLDDLPDIAGSAFAGCFPGCLLSIVLPIGSLAVVIAFATGDTDEGWTYLAVVGVAVVWALALIVGRLWRRADP